MVHRFAKQPELFLLQIHLILAPLLPDHLRYLYLPIWITGLPLRDNTYTAVSAIINSINNERQCLDQTIKKQNSATF